MEENQFWRLVARLLHILTNINYTNTFKKYNIVHILGCDNFPLNFEEKKDRRKLIEVTHNWKQQ